MPGNISAQEATSTADRDREFRLAPCYANAMRHIGYYICECECIYIRGESGEFELRDFQVTVDVLIPPMVEVFNSSPEIVSPAPAPSPLDELATTRREAAARRTQSSHRRANSEQTSFKL